MTLYERSAFPSVMCRRELRGTAKEQRSDPHGFHSFHGFHSQLDRFSDMKDEGLAPIYRLGSII